MAKTKPKKSKKSKRKETGGATAASVLSSVSKASSTELSALLARATELFYSESLPDEALSICSQVLKLHPTSLPAISLAGEINVELGEVDTARSLFAKAAELDPDGSADGPEKFLWLAQLSETGGEDAIRWYEKGIELLKNSTPLSGVSGNNNNNNVDETTAAKLCAALCGMAEIYMTDLCMEPDAESRCEAYVTEALLVSPSSPEALQTLASVRISQVRLEDARAALGRAYTIWKDAVEAKEIAQTYPSRVSFSRLLIEMEMYDEAVDVLDQLQEEDDQVLDVWYLGGWCMFLMGSKLKEQEAAGSATTTTTMNGGGGKGKGKESSSGKDDEEEEDTWQSLWTDAREWLGNCMKVNTHIIYIPFPQIKFFEK